MLKNRVILITGASKGIGAETAKLLAAHGAYVAVNYNTNKEKAKEVIKMINSERPSHGILVKADITKDPEVKNMVKEVVGKFKRIDVLINNASSPIAYLPLEKVRWADFQTHLDVTLRGSLNTIKNVLPHMKAEKKGKIINVLSSVTIATPPPKPIDYISAKYALLGFSKALAVELGPFGITVNCVSPGMTETDLVKDLPAKMKEVAAYHTPLKRLARPIDVAQVIWFLSSDYSDYITGANIPVCGGSVM